jgi:tetratricopeptide (TPR) repeat protein
LLCGVAGKEAKQSSSPNFASALKSAEDAESKESFVEAYELYIVAGKLNAKDASVPIGLAACLEGMKETEEAALVLERACKSEPNNIALWRALSQLSVRSGDFIRAEQAAEKMLSINPKSMEALSILADLQLQRQDGDAARQLANKMIAVDPQNRAGYITLARSYFEADNDAAKEIAVLDQATKALPHDGQLYSTLATYFRNQGDLANKKTSGLQKAMLWWQVAERAYKLAIENEPNNDRMRVDFANLLAEQHKYAEAIVQAEVALKINPKNLDAKTLEQKIHSAKSDLAGQLKRWLK